MTETELTTVDVEERLRKAGIITRMDSTGLVDRLVERAYRQGWKDATEMVERLIGERDYLDAQVQQLEEELR